MSTEITKREPGILMPAVEINRLIEVRKQIGDALEKALVPNVDYVQIPGTPKPCLAQAGAEKIMMWFDVGARYEIVEKEIDHDRPVRWQKVKRVKSGVIREAGESYGLYRYTVRCVLFRRGTGDVVGEAIGSASTLESRYCDRPRDCENTVLQMAEKRAMVRAVRNVFGLSDRFTQDLEGGEDEDAEAPAAGEQNQQEAPKHEPTPAQKPPEVEVLSTSGLVESVEIKTGKRTDGKEYTRAVVVIGGERFYTFDRGLIEKSEAAKAGGQVIHVTYTTGRFGRDLRSAKLDGEKEATQAEIPF